MSHPLQFYEESTITPSSVLARAAFFQYNQCGFRKAKAQEGSRASEQQERGRGSVFMKERIQANPNALNLVVARYRDGKIIRGMTHDFGTQKKVFHVSTVEKHGRTINGKVHKIPLSELKAVFFVKSLEGRQGPPPAKGLLEERSRTPGLVKMRITFFDGEILEGTTHGYTPEREGFFVAPLDRDSNNLRIFVVSSAVKNVETWK